jgi:uncharacterized Zn finger protein
MRSWGFERKPSVHERRQRAARTGQRLAKSGEKLSPVVIDGRTIASSFWGKAWCENLESYRDYEYRLPRGRSYVRNRAVLDLNVSVGKVAALVSGSDLYKVAITIKPLAQPHWSRIKTQCAGQVGSLIELLEGRLSERVMKIVTHRDDGLFPKPSEIQMECSCPDWATMCKHVAAVLYGVGARLDHQPELLFTLRKVDQAELIAQATDFEVTRGNSKRKTLANDELASVFGIELDATVGVGPAHAKPRVKRVGIARAVERRPKSAASKK